MTRAGRGRRAASLLGAAGVGYLAGTIPTADLAAMVVTGGRVDLRTVGSGNPGAYNAAKVLGPAVGYAVMAGDIAKGVGASIAGRRLAGDVGAHVGATGAVVGHCFPLWSGFRGGKGVAAAIGQLLATFPAFLPMDAAIAALAAAPRPAKGRALVATAAASAAWVAGGVVWWRKGWPNLWGPPPSAALPAAAALSSGVIMYRFLAAPSGRVGPRSNDDSMPSSSDPAAPDPRLVNTARVDIRPGTVICLFFPGGASSP